MKQNTTSNAKKFKPYDIYNWITDAPLKPGPKIVLLALARYMRKENGVRVWPSQTTIGKKVLMHRNSVSIHLRTLEKLGYIYSYLFAAAEHGNTSDCDWYEYDLNIGFDPRTDTPIPAEIPCTPLRKKYAPPAQKTGTPLHKKQAPPCTKTVHKGDISGKGLNVENIEVPTERTTPSACAGGTGFKTEKQTRREKAKQICRDYKAGCKSSAKAREAFWHKLGRIHFPDSPQFFPDHNLTHLQRKTMTRLFEDMPTTGCYVLAHVFRTWPTDGKRKTPNLSALEEYGSTDLYQSWKQATGNVTNAT